MARMISFPRLALGGLRFYRRTHLSVFVGATLSVAVLVGALLVGDSVRYSLRRFALLRLGNTETVLQARGRFFDASLAEAVGEGAGVPVHAALLMRGIALRQDPAGGDPIQVNRIQVLGVRPDFWTLAGVDARPLAGDEVALSEKLAHALGARAGDEIAIRVGQPSLMPRDAPLSSRKETLSRRGTFRVQRVVPDTELGRFSLDANQIVPPNAFVNIAWLQQTLKLESRANLLLAGRGEEGTALTDALGAKLREAWRLEHVGIRFRREVEGVLQLESDRIFLDPETSRAAMDVPEGTAPPVGVLTYLVNRMRAGEGDGARRTPYAFVTACSPTDNAALGPVPAGMADDRVIVNRWLADTLQVEPGQTLTMDYYQLGPSGQFVEKSRPFTVHAVVEMDALDAERRLMPAFPGLTDVNSCREWDIGMPMDEDELRDEANEAYWQTYRATPKAFVTLRAGQEMWANRFGDLSAIRYPADVDAATQAGRLTQRIDPARIGLFFLPVRDQALKAVSEAMDFGELFLSMSFFLIVSALMLTGLLFVFGVQQRAEEMGTLLAVGLRPGHVRALLLWEAGFVALLGAAAGGWLGTNYTRALIWGLGTYWKGAVAGSAIRYHAEPATVVAGAAAGFLCALLTAAVAMWRQARRPARELLAADLSQELAPTVPRRRVPWVGWLLCTVGALGAVAIVAAAGMGDGAHLVPAFFGAGSLLLLSGMGAGSLVLKALETRSAAGRLTLRGLGVRNASRRRGRSLTAMGLLASGSFMVFAVSSMKEDVGAHADERWSGTGGFELFAESTLPVPDALETAKGREAFNLHRDERMAAVSFVSLKVHDGDDASCFNLNRAQAPRLLGVDPDVLAGLGAFVPEGSTSPLWERLDMDLPDGVVPGLVGDSDTAMWGLQKKVGPETGDELVYKDERGNTFRVRLVGKLPMRLSVFQGTVLVSAAAFTARYPSEEGYRMFLVDCPPEDVTFVQKRLSGRLARVGMDVTRAPDRLVEFYSVESTYLGMFLVLGGLGLLLGTIGMGIVVLRNVLERRTELALLRCVGFTPRAVARVVLAEHWMLLLGGVGIGVASSVLAIWPNLTAADSSVPYAMIAAILGGVLVVGLLWIAGAARLALRGSLLSALRNE